MKVLTISNMGPKPSAPLLGLFVSNQIDRLKEQEVDIDYFNMAWNGDSIIHKLFKYPWFFLSFLFRCTFSNKKYDILHIHYYYPTILCGYFYKKFINRNTKIIVTCHGGDIYCYENAGGFYESCVDIVDHWIFSSTLLQKRFRFPVTSYSILSTGFDDKTFYMKAPIKDSKYNCLMVGAVDQNKGIDRLLKIAESAPKLSFAVVGEGTLRGKFQNVAPHNVDFLGARSKEQVASLLSESDILLSLSRRESFGLVISEAHACGVSVVATETDGSKEQIKDTRFIVAQDNEEKLVQQVLEKIEYVLASHDKSAMNLKHELVSLALPYSLTNVSSQIFKIYKSLLN